MGAIAEGIAAYAQPLLDQTDGSLEQMNKAFALGALCYNLALLPEDSRNTTLNNMRPSLNMDDAEFDEFRRDVIAPMIERHHAMFPRMHQRVAAEPFQIDPAPPAHARITAPAEAHPVTDRYAPCPCNSGEKYKFCCGKKGR